MEKKLTGVVVGVKNYGNNKMITLLCAEEGLTNILVETSLPQPKFMYAKELLTFGHFFVDVKGSFFCVLKKCEVVDAFSFIKNKTAKFSEAVNLCGVVKELAQYNDQDTPLFLEFMQALKTLNYQTTQTNLVLCKFLCSVFAGFSNNLNFQTCFLCGEELTSPIYINLDTATFVCKECKSKNALLLPNNQLQNLQQILQTDYQTLANQRFANLEEMLKILFQVFQFKVAERFKLYCE